MRNGRNHGPYSVPNGPPPTGYHYHPPHHHYPVPIAPSPSQCQYPVAAMAAPRSLEWASVSTHLSVAAAAAVSSQQFPSTATASAPKIPATNDNSKPLYKKYTKKYNNFNIFFMLERQFILQSRGGGIDAIEKPIDTSDAPLVKHKELHLPPLCRRYSHLPLTSNWFLELTHHHNKKRKHEKTHGLIPFKELAQTVAKNYREIDDDTQSFVNEVAERLGWHCGEMEATGKQEWEEKWAAGVHGAGGPGVRSSSDGKKRKDAPVVSVAGAKGAAAGVKLGSLSQDEAAIVQQLMGTKARSPTSAQPPGRPQGTHPSSTHPHPLHPSAVHTHPMMTHTSDSEAEREALTLTEAERLQIEMARAMNSHRESERRIHFLKEQMTRHHAARTQQDQLHHRAAQAAAISPSVLRSLPAGYDRYLASLLAGSPLLASRSHPTAATAAAASRPHSAPDHSRMKSPESQTQSAAKAYPNSLQKMEKELPKEALARRPIHRGVQLEALYPGADAALRGNPLEAHPVASMAHPPQHRNDRGAPLKKRQRFTSEKSDGGDYVRKQSPESKEEEGNETDERAASEEPKSSAAVTSSGAARLAAAAGNRSVAHLDETGSYKDLFAKVMPPRHRPAPNPSPQDLAFFDSLTAAAVRDLAFFDNLTNSSLSLSTSVLGRSISGDQGAQQALLESSTRGSRPSPHLTPHYPPPPHLAAAHDPPHPGRSHGLHGDSYVALLSRMTAGRQHPVVHIPPPIATAASLPLPGSYIAARATSASPPKQKSSLLEIVHTASRKSQFGLSYNDIMDVWKEMNKDNSGNGCEAGGEGGNSEGQGEVIVIE